MASNMANLLMEYGPQIAGIVKSNRKAATDLETEKLRQALLQGQITESQLGSAFKQKQIDAADLETQRLMQEEQRKREAQSAMAKALSSYKGQKEMAGTISNAVNEAKGMGLMPQEEEHTTQQYTMRQAAEEAGVPKYTDQPGTKEFYEQNIQFPEELEYKKGKPATGLGMTTQQKREDWNRIASMPDGAEKDKAIDDYMMVYAPGQKYPLSEKGINEKINLERSLIPVKSETEKSTTKAGKIGGIEGETEANQTAIPGFKPIQGVNITNDSVKKVKAAASQIETMKSLADDLINKYNKMGTAFTGDDAADYSSKVRNLQLMAKGPEFYNLGVLTGPDLSLLEETIPNPSSIKEGVKKIVLGDISVKLNNFKNMLNEKSEQFYRLNGFEQEKPQKQKKVYNPQTGKFELR